MTYYKGRCSIDPAGCKGRSHRFSYWWHSLARAIANGSMIIRLMIIQKRCSFSILADNCTLLSDASVLAKQFRSPNDQREHKKRAGNDKGENPL